MFVDGIRQTASADDSSLPSPKDIAGIELYAGPSSAPLQYGKDAALARHLHDVSSLRLEQRGRQVPRTGVRRDARNARPLTQLAREF